MRMKAYKAIFPKILHEMKSDDYAPALLPGIVGRGPMLREVAAALRAADVVETVRPNNSPVSQVAVGGRSSLSDNKNFKS